MSLRYPPGIQQLNDNIQDSCKPVVWRGKNHQLSSVHKFEVVQQGSTCSLIPTLN